METIKLEKHIQSSPIPIFVEGIKTILFQMKSCICKIYKKDNITGTGFFCLIPFQNQLLPVLITNNHVLNKEDLKIGNVIILTINNNKEKREIQINNTRKIITSQKYDITIIEIKPNEDKINNFLEIDNDLNINKDILELTYRSKSIYILHYPEKKNMQVSFGLINNLNENVINHYCTTYEGSSGSPILSLETFKVVGIHYGHSSKEFNKGIFIQTAVNEFNRQYQYLNKDKNKYNINNNDINKDKFNENSKDNLFDDSSNLIVGNSIKVKDKQLEIKINEKLYQNTNEIENNKKYLQAKKAQKLTNNIEEELLKIKKEEEKLLKAIENMPILSFNTPTLIGLNNIGATPFMNATLQCLSQTEDLTNYFLKKNLLNILK